MPGNYPPLNYRHSLYVGGKKRGAKGAYLNLNLLFLLHVLHRPFAMNVHFLRVSDDLFAIM